MENIKIPYLRNENDAKEKAGEYLKNIFNEQILTIDSIKLMINLCHKKENQYSLEVFNKIEHNISELDSSLKAIDQMILNMTETSQKQNQFYNGWKKITDPINVYGSDLEKLMLSKKNVSLMLHNLNMYVRVQDQIEEMRNLLNEDDSNIVTVFKQIRYLSYLRIALLERVKTQERSDKLNNVADHLMCVQKYEDEFFEKFWSYFEDIVKLVNERPEFLVKLLRIIEEDPEYLSNIRNVFQTYQQTTDKFKGIINYNSNSIIPNDSLNLRETQFLYDNESESLKENLKYKIPQFIKNHFKQKFSDKGTREEILDETLEEIKELYTIKIKVVPCFPPSYDIFTIYKNNYLNLIKEKIQPFLKEEELEQSPGLLIPIAHWLSQFDEILTKIGINLNDTDIIGDVEYYMHLFYDHINNVLDSNLKNAIQKNLNDKKNLKNQQKDLDKIQSFYASDIYNSLMNILDTLSGDFKGQLLFQIVKILFEKISLLIKSQNDEINQLNSGDELIIACVYVSDSSKCLEIFPTFKKKCKSLLPKDLYKHIKLRFISSNPSILSEYNNSIRIGCNKVIELMFMDLSKNYLNKIFTSEWNDDVLNDIFGTFEEYFNKGFVKILKTQNNLLIIVRSFIDSFVNYYVEELIHSIRSLNRKLLKSFKESALVNYHIKYLTIDKEDIVYKEKKKKDKEIENPENKKEENIEWDEKNYKDLNTKDNKDKNQKKYKRYNFPVKKFKEEDKKYNALKIIERVQKDKEIFEQFLDGFSEECQVPFSKFFSQTLGENFIKTFIEKMNAIIQIMNCHESVLKEQITNLKRYYDVNAKALCEALLYVRSDTPEVTKPEKRVIYLSVF